MTGDPGNTGNGVIEIDAVPGPASAALLLLALAGTAHAARRRR